MATWDITVNARSGVGVGSSASNSVGTVPGDFDGATIDDVAVLSSPTITTDGATDDSISIFWYIASATPTATYGSALFSSSFCRATLGSLATSATITENGSATPTPTTAVASDWDRVTYGVSYSITMKDDAETCSWSAFTIRVTYTPAPDSDDLLADDVESASEVGSPQIGQTHALASADLSSASEVTSPVIGQVQVLAATDVESASELTSPALAEVSLDDLLAEDVESASELTSPALGQVHALTSVDVASASEVGSPSVGGQGLDGKKKSYSPTYAQWRARHLPRV